MFQKSAFQDTAFQPQRWVSLPTGPGAWAATPGAPPTNWEPTPAPTAVIWATLAAPAAVWDGINPNQDPRWE